MKHYYYTKELLNILIITARLPRNTHIHCATNTTPKTVKLISTPEDTARMNERVVFSCTASSSWPKPEFRWYLNGKDITELASEDFRQHSPVGSTLSISVNDTLVNQQLRCVAENPYFPKRKAFDAVKLLKEGDAACGRGGSDEPEKPCLSRIRFAKENIRAPNIEEDTWQMTSVVVVVLVGVLLVVAVIFISVFIVRRNQKDKKKGWFGFFYGKNEFQYHFRSHSSR